MHGNGPKITKVEVWRSYHEPRRLLHRDTHLMPQPQFGHNAARKYCLISTRHQHEAQHRQSATAQPQHSHSTQTQHRHTAVTVTASQHAVSSSVMWTMRCGTAVTALVAVRKVRRVY